MRALPGVDGRRCGVFTLAEAAAAGWTRDAVRHALATGRIERVRGGCFAAVPGEALSQFQKADLRLARAAVAASLTVDGASVSHLGAARVFGLPIWASAPRPCITTATRQSRATGVHVHRSSAPPDHFGTAGGVPITSPERTVVDVAREFGVEAGLVVADAAARRGLVRRDDLADAIHAVGRHGDVAAAREVARWVDPDAESPLESRSRWQLLCHGLPPPQTQTSIYSLDGRFIGRTDFFWAVGVIGEVAGSGKYELDRDGENRVLGAEKWRQEQLEDLDLEVVRWGSRHLREFGPTAVRLRRAFVRAAARAGEPRWIAVPSGTVWS